MNIWGAGSTIAGLGALPPVPIKEMTPTATSATTVSVPHQLPEAGHAVDGRPAATGPVGVPRVCAASVEARAHS